MSVGAGIALVVVAAGVLAGWLGGAAMARSGRARTDVPDARRLHTEPTARGGGIGIIIAGMFALPFGQWLGGDHEAALIGVVVLAWATPNAFVGLADDYVPLSARLKLGLQLAAAVIAVSFGLRLDCLNLAPLPPLALGVFAWPVSVVALVWLANLFNFMDGSDGLAAGCGAVMFTGMAALGLLAGSSGAATIALGLAAGCAGFFVVNRPPARIFMGDGGSLFAGACLGGCAVLLAHHDGGAVPVSAVIIATAPFWFDTTYTLLVRVWRREQVFEAHRQHLYQRLAAVGWTAWQVLGLYTAMTAGCVGLALLLPRVGGLGQGGIWAGVASGVAGLVLLVANAEHKRDANHAGGKKPDNH